jgi:hypothetical protein
MTQEQWQQEFRQEIRGLHEPSLRLYALLQLYPDETQLGQDIKDALEAAEKEMWNQGRGGFDVSLLERLYYILTALPTPRWQMDMMKKQYELSEIQELALTELLAMGILIPEEFPLYGEASAKEALDQIAKVCLRWRVLLDPMQKELEPIREEIRFIYKGS